jgi:hypothetical protein
VLAAAKVPVVLQCAFVEFVSTIVELFAVVAERLHLIGRERLEIAQDRQILVEKFHGIDAADGRGDGQAHGAGKRFGAGGCAVRDGLAGTAHALHSQDRHTAPIGDGQNVVFKATEARVQWIERHLDNIESIATVEHLQIDRWCLCPLNPTKRTFPCCFALVRWLCLALQLAHFLLLARDGWSFDQRVLDGLVLTQS